MEKDYNTYDYLSVSVKEKNANEMEERYRDFGWEKIERVPDARFYDIELIMFKRDRYIKNKDALQYLQVVMEHKINEIAKLKQWQYLPTIVATSLLCFFVCLLLVGGALLIYFLFNLAGFISGGVLIALGAALSVVTIFVNQKLSANDSIKYKALKIKITAEIKTICEQVVTLTNEQDTTQPS